MNISNGRSQRILSDAADNLETSTADPITQAKIFQDKGFKDIYIVDRDGRLEDYEANFKTIEQIIKKTKLNVLVGGGIRSRERIDTWFDAGVEAVTLGSIALRDPELVKAAAKSYPRRVILGISMQDNRVVSRSQNTISDLRPMDLALQFDGSQLRCILLTDVNRDGALMGANVDIAADVAMAITTPVYLSGGVSCIADLQEIKSLEKLGVEGVLCGRALYDKKVEADMALSIMEAETENRPHLPTDGF